MTNPIWLSLERRTGYSRDNPTFWRVLEQLQEYNLWYHETDPGSSLASPIQTADINPLTNLRQLRKLKLNLRQIVSLSPLANLTQLQKLNLSYNQIVNLIPLANLHQLQKLNLSYNQIVDLIPLANLHQLQKLYLNGNPINEFPQNLEDLQAMQRMKQAYYRVLVAEKWPVAYQKRLEWYILDALMGYPENLLAIKGEI